MAQLTKANYSEGGLADINAQAANAGGDKVANGNSKVILIIKNDDASPHTVTVAAQVASAEDAALGTITKDDATVTVAAGGIGMLGPFPAKAFNDVDGNINLSYDGVTSLSVAPVEKG